MKSLNILSRLPEDIRKAFGELSPQWSQIVDKYGIQGIKASANSVDDDPKFEQSTLLKIRKSCILTRQVPDLNYSGADEVIMSPPTITSFDRCVVGEYMFGQLRQRYWSQGGISGCIECTSIANEFDSLRSNKHLVETIVKFVTHAKVHKK